MTPISLENRISAVLNDADTPAKLFSQLLIEITESALPLNEREQIVVKVKIADPMYPSASAKIGKSALEKLIFERERLEAAVPVLQKKYEMADHHERFIALRPKYNHLVDSFNDCIDKLNNTYREAVDKLIPLLHTAEDLNVEIRRFNASREAAEFRDELRQIPTIGDGLLEFLVLPGTWPDPKKANQFAAAFSEAAARSRGPLADLAFSPDWHAAKTLQDEAKKASWAERNKLQKRQQQEAKQEYYNAQKEAAKAK